MVHAVRRLESARLDDPSAERTRISHHDAIVELQELPFSAARIISDRELASGVETQIAHGLGRLPAAVFPSAIRGSSTAGVIEEIRSSGADRRRFVVLKASGFGSTITVDLVVL